MFEFTGWVIFVFLTFSLMLSISNINKKIMIGPKEKYVNFLLTLPILLWILIAIV